MGTEKPGGSVTLCHIQVPFRRKGSKKDRLEVKDHFKMEKGNKTMCRKGVKARVEVSPENLNSTNSEERSGIVSPYSYKDFGGFKDNSLENLKEMERQIEISKQQSRGVELGNFRDSSCHSEDAQLYFKPRTQNYKQRDKVSSWRRSGKRKACKKRYAFEISSLSSESDDDEVKPVLKYLMKYEGKETKI